MAVRVAGKERMAGKRRVAGRRRVAAPLLGGGWGWVYRYAPRDLGITIRKKYSGTKPFANPLAIGCSCDDPSIICRMQVNPPPNPSEEGSRDATCTATRSLPATRTAMRPFPATRPRLAVPPKSLPDPPPVSFPPVCGLLSFLSGRGRNCPLPNRGVAGKGLILRPAAPWVNWHICWRKPGGRNAAPGRPGYCCPARCGVLPLFA